MRYSLSILISIFGFFVLYGQYTDQINSNRPGASIGAFSVGKNVVQFEGGTELRSYKHRSYNNSKVDANLFFLSVRYGLLSEKIELTYDGVYEFDKIENLLINPSSINKRKGFLNNFLGIKYLIYDPFKKERKINVYSWKANNGFKLRDLLPAVSLTIGGNLILEKENPFPYGNVFDELRPPLFFGIPREDSMEPSITGKATLATQSHFFGRWVFVTNFIYNRISSQFPEFSYIITLTHTINKKWSAYIETQDFSSDLYKDQIFRAGAAYLFNDDLQFEATLGSNTKNSPSIFFFNLGASYRLDFHKDVDPEAKKEEKLMKKEEKMYMKGAKKAQKADKKRNKKARKKPND
tara:strand:- start:541 stop:1593 length:1053 start_codon:yes stop_codon:yes gene_type:complete